MAYSVQGLYPQAIQDLSQAIRLIPPKSAIYNERAIAYLGAKNYILALNDFNVAIQLNPDAGWAYLGRGKVYEALGNPIAALHDYMQGCQLDVAEACTKTQ